jgi:hypothetical protein
MEIGEVGTAGSPTDKEPSAEESSGFGLLID